MCTARDGKFAGKKICVEKKFQCDNHLQCQDGKDEEMCEEEYKTKRIFTMDELIICRSPFLNITSEENKKGKFFTMRGIRCNPVVIIVSILAMITPKYIKIVMITTNTCSGATRSPSVHMARMKRVATFLSLLVLS